jgi:hypothetical protein
MTMPTEPTVAEPTVATPSPTSVRTFTAEEVEKFRADERNKAANKVAKLQAQFDETNAKLAEVAAAQAARDAAETAEAEARAAALKNAEEADLDAKQLLDKRQAEWEEKFAKLEHDQRQKEAALALERQYLEMKAYIQGRWAEETANHTIHPTFKDYIDGTTVEEVEASLALAKQKTDLMAQEIAAREGGRQQQAFQTGQGVGTWTGPSDMGHAAEGGDEVDFTDLSYADFVKNRSKLIRTNGNSGIFG